MRHVILKETIRSQSGTFNLVDKGAIGTVMETRGGYALVEFDDYGIPVRTWVNCNTLEVNTQ